MRNFEYYSPTKVFFGKDTHFKAGEILKEYGCRKALIHYGSESAVKSGLINDICKSLTDAGIDFVTLGGVVPNPHLSKVREGISLCHIFFHASPHSYTLYKMFPVPFSVPFSVSFSVTFSVGMFKISHIYTDCNRFVCLLPFS